MNCAQAEILICDLVDGTLAGAGRAELERHLSTCAACAGLARDSRAAVAFMERAAVVEPPPELITRILFDPPWAKQRRSPTYGLRAWLRRTWLGGALNAVLQPRVAMGMAMTILSFSMLSRFVTPMRPLTAEDLQPARVWASVEDRGYRVWARSVKFYENLKFVYKIQSTLREWQQQQEDEQRQAGDAEDQKPDDRKLPVTRPPSSKAAPATGPATELKRK